MDWFDWFCYNLNKALLFSRNQIFCLKIWKLWQAPTTLQLNIFCWNFAYVSYLPPSTKECLRFFLFCLDLELFVKITKTWFLRTCFLHPRHPFVDIGKLETCAKFQENILNCRVVGARQSLQIFRQNTWFLKNNRTLHNNRISVWEFALLN